MENVNPVMIVLFFIAIIVILKMIESLFPPKEIIAGDVFALETRQRKVFFSAPFAADSSLSNSGISAVVIDVPERLLKIKDCLGKIVTVSGVPEELFREIRFREEKVIVVRKYKWSGTYEFSRFIDP